MNIQDYIRAQSALGLALKQTKDKSPNFALFSAMLGECVDLERQHIVDEQEALLPDPLDGINYHTQKQFHLMAKDADYSRSYDLACCLQSSIEDFKLLMSVLSHPLSLHDDPQYIDEQILSNCPHKTQVKLKTRNSDAYFDTQSYDSIADAETYPTQAHLLFDTISQSQEATKAIEV